MTDGTVSAPLASPRFGRYPEYRDSGADWLGEIPAHWRVKRLKYSMSNIVTQTVAKIGNEGERDLYVALEHVESWTGRLNVADDGEGMLSDGQVVKRFRAGDVLFGKLRPYLAKVTRPHTSGVCVGEFLVLRPRDRGVLAAYMENLLRSRPIIDTVNSSTFGAKMPRADWQFLAGLEVPRPSLYEQRAIANFLDREAARIDALVAKQHELIKLLHEKRTALISHAVGKGLDPDVAMKDSGVEWLGEIPAHWEVKRTKFAATLRSGHTPSRQKAEYWKDCTIPWFGLADVWQIRDGQVEYVQETAEKISEIGLANSAARHLPAGTVILSRTASVGFSAILGVDMATTQDFVNWVCGPSLRPEYLLYVFRAMGPEFQRLTMGSTHQTIYMHDVGGFSTPVPHVSEQDQMVAFVRKEVADTDAMIAKVNEAIKHLTEYRTALISAAVTGKIDVRHYGEHTVSDNTPTTQARP